MIPPQRTPFPDPPVLPPLHVISPERKEDGLYESAIDGDSDAEVEEQETDDEEAVPDTGACLGQGEEGVAEGSAHRFSSSSAGA